MENTLLEELMQLPPDDLTATVRGVQMQTINADEARSLLASDPDDRNIHECRLANGHYLFQAEDGKLISLYKVIDMSY